MPEKIPAYVARVLERLEENGFDAFIVGGAVRDLVLGKAPLDFDVATSATPAQIQPLFDKTLTVGAQYGTVIVLIDDERVEVTTFRSDGDYLDGRRPNRVRFAGELTTDLSRRDFTVNAMAMDKDLNIVDPYGGMADIKNRLIRCVGDPYKRLTEDALRILRAYRFAAMLDFSLEEATKEAIKACAGNMERLSSERVMAEVLKLLKSRRPEMIYDVLATRGLESWFGRANFPVISKLGELEGDEALRFAVFFIEIGADPDDSQNILKRLRASNLFIKRVVSILKCSGEQMPESSVAVRRLRSRYEDSHIEDALLLKKVVLGQEITKAAAIFKAEREKGGCTSLRDLALKGEDLEMLGFAKGPDIGRALDFLFDRVIEDPEKNNKETLLSLAKGLLKY